MGKTPIFYSAVVYLVPTYLLIDRIKTFNKNTIVLPYHPYKLWKNEDDLISREGEFFFKEMKKKNKNKKIYSFFVVVNYGSIYREHHTECYSIVKRFVN